MKHKIAVAQFEIQIGSPDVNIAAGLSYIQQAIQQGCDLIVLPELWISGYDLENGERYLAINQEVLDLLRNLARNHNLHIGGTYIRRNQAGLSNTFILVQPGEEDPLEYNKIHLYRALDEAVYFLPGSQISFADTSIGRIGLAICYDLRFPELFRAYNRSQVNLLLVSAQWGAERVSHWRNLLRARAIENQCFVAAANAVGPLRDKSIAGYSAIIDPWGEILAEADDETQMLLTAEIDFDMILAAAVKIPSREDARNDLYATW